jgi:Coenzyme PQQ synthesis protein D (PqqD)
MKGTNQLKPRARTEGLVIETLPDETLVYDLDRDVAHCLNQTASLVWRRCDGSNTTKQIARALTKELDQPVDESLVWLALNQLERNRLLRDPVPAHIPAIDRRDVIRALAVGAVVAVPVVASIVAPAPAQAASCFPNGSGCETSAECCSNFCNQGTCGVQNS